MSAFPCARAERAKPNAKPAPKALKADRRNAQVERGHLRVIHIIGNPRKVGLQMVGVASDHVVRMGKNRRCKNGNTCSFKSRQVLQSILVDLCTIMMPQSGEKNGGHG